MASPPTPDFEQLIAGVSRALEARGVPFMLIGGQAVLLHGEPRLTQDIDITLGVAPDRLPAIMDAAKAAGVVRRKGERLDWEYVGRWAEDFATVPGREELPEQVEELRRKR